MSTEKEAKLEELLTDLCWWSKNNCNGGGVFTNDVKAKVVKIIKEIKQVIES
jgi:hypothetical protein